MCWHERGLSCRFFFFLFFSVSGKWQESWLLIGSHQCDCKIFFCSPYPYFLIHFFLYKVQLWKMSCYGEMAVAIRETLLKLRRCGVRILGLRGRQKEREREREIREKHRERRGQRMKKKWSRRKIKNHGREVERWKSAARWCEDGKTDLIKTQLID